MSIEEMLALEHQGWRALCDGTGADFYGQLMTDDGVMVLAHGEALDRSEVVKSLHDAPPWRTYEIADPRLTEAGDRHAILVYTGRAWREGDEPAFTALMTSVYVRAGEAWRLAHYQQTPVPPAP